MLPRESVAIEWTANLPESRRGDYVIRSFQGWIGSDREAALSWMEQAPLNDQLRRSLKFLADQ